MASAAEEAPARPGRRIVGYARDLLIVVVAAVVIAALTRALLGQMYLIPSGSMEHTLEIGDRIAAQKVTDFARGDIVVFTDPGRWTDPLPDGSADKLVKRVIGMPGDRVRCCDADGRITVNGQPLDESSYVFGAGGEDDAPSEFPFDVVVPADRIWVMGDHRASSEDSRCHLNDSNPAGRGMAAFVPTDKVVGTVFAVVTPLSHGRLIKRPTTFDTVPDGDEPPALAGINLPNVRC